MWLDWHLEAYVLPQRRFNLFQQGTVFGVCKRIYLRNAKEIERLYRPEFRMLAILIFFLMYVLRLELLRPYIFPELQSAIPKRSELKV